MALSAGTRVGVPAFKTDGAEHRRDLVRHMQETQIGHFACIGTVTLAENSNTTVVNDSRAGVASFIWFMPTTQNAAAEIANGNIYVSSRGKQTFTITHTNNAQTDRTFVFVVLG